MNRPFRHLAVGRRSHDERTLSPEGIEGFPDLRTLKVDMNVDSLAPLARAPRLLSLVCRSPSDRDLEPLHALPGLRRVEIVGEEGPAR